MDSKKELISLGKRYFENKEYAKAEEYLLAALDNGLKYADVYNVLGVIAHAKGKFGDAVKMFTTAIKQNPKYTEALLNLAVLYNDLGEYDSARRVYAQLRNNSTSHPSAIEPVLRGKISNMHAELGDIYRSIGMHSLSIDEYKKALSLNQTYNDIRTKLGQTLRENGEHKKALGELKTVLKGSPKFVPALIQEGITHYSMNNFTAAKRSWMAALKASPANRDAQMYLGLCEAVKEGTHLKQPKHVSKTYKIKTSKRASKRR